jgi:hypothetical protein
MKICKIALLATILVMALASCLQTSKKNENGADSSFVIHIGEWDKTVSEANLGYTVESSWPLLSEWYPTGTTFTIETTDIDSYDWQTHVLTLTPEASANYRSTFETAKLLLGFVVTVRDEPQYGGVFLFRMSAMGISFPVIYADPVDNKIAFTIRPRHSVFDDYSPSEEWRGIDNPAIKDALLQAGKLKQ